MVSLASRSRPSLSSAMYVYILTHESTILTVYPLQDPFFVSAVKQGVVPESVFGFKLAPSGSELYIGGTNSRLFSGSLEYHPIVKDNGFWQIGGGKALLNGRAVASNIQTIIDSGTTLMGAAESTVAAFYNNIPGSGFNDRFQTYTFPCDQTPQVSFSWGGKTWAIDVNE